MGIGSHTIIGYVLVKNGVYFVGTKREILSQICKFWFVDRVLHFQFKDYPSSFAHSYNKSYSLKEMEKDAVDCIFSRVFDYGYHLYGRVI